MSIDDIPIGRGPATPPTREQVKAAIEMVMAVGDTIRDLGSVPSGELYARLMGHMTLNTYNMLIERLKGAGVVKEEAHLLTWTGPAKKS